MKKLQVFVLSFMMIFTTFNLNVSALSNDQEMRAAWISTVYNMDWPSTKNNQAKQKQEYIDLIDKLKASGINTVVVQVRPKGDAIYKSSINPWSEYLTGTQGKDPGYDPLPFLIDEAHKRGMEFHAWFNPYRVTTSTTDLNTLSENHPARRNPSWVIEHKNGAYQALAYNPGLPEVRKHIVDSVSEVVRNYNIDGVHFDDYFYRDGMNDDETYKKYGNGQDKGDWRRENVNTLLREVKSSIKSIKSNVKFGVSPSGIWRNKSSDPTGSDTRGQESYSDLFADSRAWIKQGLVDYIVPQVYWPIGFSAADYSKLVSWWSNEVKGTNVNLYIGQGVYKQGESSNGNQNIAAQIKDQINLNRQYSEIKGSMYFSARDITRNTKLQSDMKELYFSNIAIRNLRGNERYDTAVEVSKEGWKNGSESVVLTNGNSVVDGVTATPLATSKDAPILLTEKGKIPEATKAELKRLNPKNIVVIGGTTVVDENALKELNTILPSAQVKRIGGIDRYETSLLIAKEIASPINKVYVTGGYGEADSLSIASKAGEEKQPIILSEKESINNDTYNWLKTKNLQDAYFIGGSQVLSDKVIEKINSLTSNNVSNNRVFGENRQETNAKVIEKFYTDSKYSSVLVTKSDPLVDALTAGPLAAKLKSPIVILGNKVSPLQNSVLDKKNTTLVYQVGGGINQTAFNKTLELLK
ncbi:family 10 glycosylhydrolase [Romboutsia sedimentorum]|uniref:Family 10 glycosylhydrolase n=1 Tax=Romboutsia sedimentorum TaxID=1368474 RepID=A0ABT7EAJ6_9FIRM|nr:family 10 glycosylhydrolase [Romboutsia sedimentorum]MDK2562986.1 family 10 glycosylhydrolase [Romboutsia sedimentorum]